MVGFDMSLDGIFCCWGKGISFYLIIREFLFEFIYFFFEYINWFWEFLLGERICLSVFVGVLCCIYFFFVNLIVIVEFGEYRLIECICEIFFIINVLVIVVLY